MKKYNVKADLKVPSECHKKKKKSKVFSRNPGDC